MAWLQVHENQYEIMNTETNGEAIAHCGICIFLYTWFYTVSLHSTIDISLFWSTAVHMMEDHPSDVEKLYGWVKEDKAERSANGRLKHC